MEAPAPLRVLIVQAVRHGSGQVSPWVQRQVRALAEMGVETETYVFSDRRSVKGVVTGGRGLREAAKAFGADLVHVHYGALQAALAVAFSPVPVAVSYCGSDLMGNYSETGTPTLSGRLSVLLSRLAATRAARTLAKSEGLRQRLWGARARRECEVIPNGVDLSVFRPIPQAEARAALGWDPSEPVVLYMHRSGAWVKDPDLAHEAFEIAQREVPDLRLHLVESVPADDMPLYLSAADVLLLTSRHEGSSNIIKEAMACALPVVTTDVGDARERLANVSPGAVVEGRDPADLAREVVRVIRQRQRSSGPVAVAELEDGRVAERVREFYLHALDR